MKKVVAVSPVRNRRETTLRCLRSLFDSDLGGIELRVVIVDDGSSDGTEDAVRNEFPQVTLVKGDGDLWYTGGVNAGIRVALTFDPDYILTFNDDSVFDQNCLCRLQLCAERYPNSVVGPLLLSWDEPHRLFQVSPKWSLRHGGFRHWRQQTVWTVPETVWESDLLVGNCVLFPRAAIDECGLMDEKRHPHWGDAEYTPRMKRMGWRLLTEPAARVFCQPNDPQPRLREMGAGKALGALMSDRKGAHSLRRRLSCSLAGAPNKLAGATAFLVFTIRVLFGRNAEGSWADTVAEKPLKEIYADRTLGSETSVE